MKFTSLMHISFYSNDMDRTRDFYENKLGLKPKMLVRNKEYLAYPNEPLYQAALSDPEGICILYYEIAEGQFIEFFPPNPKLEPHDKPFGHMGYSHFGLVVEDIFQTKKEFEEKGIAVDTPISIGNSKTYKFWSHDPDGNLFEVMQYTELSYQVVGHICE